VSRRENAVAVDFRFVFVRSSSFCRWSGKSLFPAFFSSPRGLWLPKPTKNPPPPPSSQKPPYFYQQTPPPPHQPKHANPVSTVNVKGHSGDNKARGCEDFLSSNEFPLCFSLSLLFSSSRSTTFEHVPLPDLSIFCWTCCRESCRCRTPFFSPFPQLLLLGPPGEEGCHCHPPPLFWAQRLTLDRWPDNCALFERARSDAVRRSEHQ